MTARRRKSKMIDRVIAIDLGNGFVKIRSTTSKGKVYRLTLPSAWAYKHEVGNMIGGSSLDLDTFYIDDVAYVWGHQVDKLKDIKVTYGHENRYLTDAFKIMAKIAMAKVVDDCEIKQDENILVVTGVPSGESNSDCEEQIKEAFIGELEGFHEVEINDKEITFKIGRVEVTSQATAAVLDRYLDDEGYVGDEDYQYIKVGVVDIGAGTSDLDVIDKLSRLNINHSVKKGFRDVYDAIRIEINKKYPTHEVSDYVLIDCLKERIYKPSRRSEEVDFSKAMDDAINELAIDIQQAIVAKWKDQTDMDEILLIGASAKELEPRLENIITGLTIPKNYDTANVDGYFKLGMTLKNNEE